MRSVFGKERLADGDMAGNVAKVATGLWRSML
jgi:hypothetical protein